jgi:hypothetical protein
LDVASDELSDLVNNEHERVARASPLHEIRDPIGQFTGRHVDLGAAFGPGIGVGKDIWIEGAESCARLADGEREHPLFDLPFLAVKLSESCLELR